MRKLIAAFVMVLLCAVPAVAQSNQTTQTSEGSHSKLLKVTVGAGLLGIGAIVAGKSSQSSSVTNSLGTSEASTHSTSQLITGLVIAGAGGIVLWQGVRADEHVGPANAVGVAAGQRSASLFIRRTW